MVNFILIIVISLQALDCFYAADKNDYSMFYTQANNPNIVFAGAQDITIPTEDEILAGKTTREIFDYYIKNQQYIMHAGGSIDGRNYTNSLEALTTNYEQGNRIFEIDLNFTSDGHLVLVHGWTEYDYKYRLGINYNAKNPVMSLEQFKKTKIYNKYTTMTIEDLIKFMSEHKYSYFILNIKGGSNHKVSTKAIKQVVAAANNDKNILNRFVIWGYNTKVIKEIKKIYKFDLLALNIKSYANMEKKLDTHKEIIEYIKKQGIDIIMYQYNDFDLKTSKEAAKAGIETFIYTVDSINFAKPFFAQGVTMAFTNKLRN